MKKIGCMFLAIILSLGICVGCKTTNASTSSDHSWTAVAETKQLNIGVYTDRFPLCYLEENRFMGYDVAIMREMATRLGVSISFCDIERSGQTAEELLKSGVIDCVIGAFAYNAELERSYTLSAPYLYDRQVLVMKRDHDYDNLADLSGVVLSADPNSPAVSRLKESPLLFSAFARVEKVTSDAEAIQSVLNGTADIAAVNETVAAYFVARGEPLRALLNDDDQLEQLGKSEYVMALALGANALKKKLEDTYVTMERDEITKKLYRQWFADLQQISQLISSDGMQNNDTEIDAETGLPISSQAET